MVCHTTENTARQGSCDRCLAIGGGLLETTFPLSSLFRMWFGCGSDVIQTWFGCGSDVVAPPSYGPGRYGFVVVGAQDFVLRDRCSVGMRHTFFSITFVSI